MSALSADIIFSRPRRYQNSHNKRQTYNTRS